MNRSRDFPENPELRRFLATHESTVPTITPPIRDRDVAALSQ